MNETLLHKLFTFRFVSLCGMVIALYVFSLTSEAKPLSSFLFSPSLYVIASLIALAVRVVLWLLIDKGTFYEFGLTLKNTFEDCIIINIVLLCSLSALFLLTSFA